MLRGALAGASPATAHSKRFAGPLLLAVAFAALAAWSWGRWPDVLVDFGNQLYLPWQILEGRVLYTDLAYKEGPLSIYALALLFGAFGLSIRTLVWTNLGLLALLCALVYGIFARGCDRLTATLAVLLFLSVFAFSQYVGIANYNFVCPYTHEQTHGTLLAVAMVVALERSLRGAAAAWAGVAGSCLGLASLTKLELFAPAAAAGALGLALVAPTAGRGWRGARAGLAAFAAGALAPPLVALGLLATRMPLGGALQALAANLHYLASVRSDPFYQRGMGIEELPRGLAEGLAAFAGVAAAAGAAAAASSRWPAAGRGRRAAAWLLALALLLLVAWRPRLWAWRLSARALPWTSAVLCAALVREALRRRRDAEALRPLLGLALWSVLAVGLLPKIWLQARVSHYGFALAMPAALLLAAALVHGVPARVRAAGRDPTLARALLAALVVAAIPAHLRWSERIYAHKTLRVGHGADAFLAGRPGFDARGWVMESATRRLRALMAPGETLLVLPEGTILNYWLRAASPSRYTLFTPPAVHFFGEAAILADLDARPPDWIAFVERPTEEFGTGRFGEDPSYGRSILDWVHARYARVERIGAEPDCEGCFDVELWRRRAGPFPSPPRPRRHSSSRPSATAGRGPRRRPRAARGGRTRGRSAGRRARSASGSAGSGPAGPGASRAGACATCRAGSSA
jgi:hypothetical protein